MEIKFYGTPREFLEENAGFLRDFEVHAQLNFGNASAHKDEPCRPDLLFGRCEENGQGVLLFGNTLPWCLCLNSVPGDPAALSAAVLLAERLQAEKIPLHGVMGSRELCGAFTFAYGGRFTLHTVMDIMMLTELTEPPVVSGTVRKAVPGDLETVTGWACAFTKEVLREEPAREALRQEFSDMIAEQGLYVLEGKDGTLLSMASTAHARQLPHGCGVSWVYTPPEHRGCKYCQNTVAALCREQMERGAQFISLFVNKANPISNRVYQKLGFRAVVDSYDFRLAQE